MVRNRRFTSGFWLTLLGLGLGAAAYAADYALPGTANTSRSDPGRGNNGFNRVARDSNGFWYVVWESAGESDIILAYTTTSTPTASTVWSLITLVDAGNSGVIQSSPANSQHGNDPAIQIGRDDVLNFMWNTSRPGAGNAWWTKCTNLTALTVSGNWATPKQAFTSGEHGGFALDSGGVPHVVGSGSAINYTKYDTSTAAFLTALQLSSNSVADVGTAGVAIDVDLDNNVYVAWKPNGANPVKVLASVNAYTAAPASSTWKNLAQTTTDPDSLDSNSRTGPALTVDYNGIVHVAYVNSTAAQEYPKVKSGRINIGWEGIATPGGTAVKDALALGAAGNGDVYLFYVYNTSTGNVDDDIYRVKYTGATTYRGPGAWGTEALTLAETTNMSQDIRVEQKAPRNRAELVWTALDDSNDKIRTSWTDRQATAAGWRPPTPTKQQYHPHYLWAFPNTATDLDNQPVPIVAHPSKSAVYVVNSSGTIYAADSTWGAYARSYKLDGTANSVLASTYSGNVHLFVQQDTTKILKLIDYGNAGGNIQRDTSWSTNPKPVGNATLGLGQPPVFFTQSNGAKYLFMVASRDPGNVGVGLYKVEVSNGAIVSGFPVGTKYATNFVESVTRILNTDIYMAGNVSQIYRRGLDGSGEIVSSVVSNMVRRAVMTRTSDAFYVAPEDNLVYRLDSGLKTSTAWTGGVRSLGTTKKTSGAMYNPTKQFLFVGVANQIYKLNESGGAILANYFINTAGNIISLPYPWKTFVYFGTDKGEVYAINMTSAARVDRANWPVLLDTTNGIPRVKGFSIDVLGNSAYVYTDEGRIYKFTLE